MGVRVRDREKERKKDGLIVELNEQSSLYIAAGGPGSHGDGFVSSSGELRAYCEAYRRAQRHRVYCAK